MKDKLDQAPGMTKRDIRETLHPTLNKDYLPRGNFFVSSLQLYLEQIPGLKSVNDQFKNTHKIKKVDN